jgi:hypothetical protein
VREALAAVPAASVDLGASPDRADDDQLTTITAPPTRDPSPFSQPPAKADFRCQRRRIKVLGEPRCHRQNRMRRRGRWGCTAAPPGTIPAASAAATYLRTVFRDSPRLPATSFFDRPACQCTKISQISITSNVLLAIGLPPQGRKA